MTRLVWDTLADQRYELGVDHGIIYLDDGTAVAWNGLINITENHEAPASNVKHFEGLKRSNRPVVDEFDLSIEAYTYPEEIDELDSRIVGLCYRTKIGDDRYRLHLIYNPLFTPTSPMYETTSNDIEALNFSWDVTTRPVAIPGYAPSSHLIIDVSTVIQDSLITYLEDRIYGSATKDPELLIAKDVILIFQDAVLHQVFLIIDHGDGSWTAIGPDDMITMTDSTSFLIDSPSAVFVDADTYTISSL